MKKLITLLFITLTALLITACGDTTETQTPVIDINFDVNGGFWSKSDLQKLRPDGTVTISEFDNYTGANTEITIFNPTDTGLRWHYKAFIQYNLDMDAYIVVYSDAYTASVDRLELPDYDFIIAAHYHNPRIEASPMLNKLFTDGVNIPILFNKDLNEPQTTVEMRVYPQSDDAILTLMSNNINNLPLPVKPDFDFGGWYLGDTLIESLDDLTISAGDTMKTLEARWESYSVESLEQFLDSNIPAHVTQNINLPSKYSGYTIDWATTHPLVINTEGRFNFAYEPTTVTLTATITSLENTVITRTFDVTVPNKKSLAAPIASSYIWRNYSSVNDAFFETLDIINTAFLRADGSGNFIGTAVLTDIYEYIFPKAKIHGNWVLFSIAPESDWVSIARSATNIERFANNIIDIINTHGFDGVDIDWETPRQGEQVWYSNMMAVIHEKVKANNPSHLVTTAITGGPWQPPMYNLSVSNAYIDYINVMTYSMASSSGSYQNALFNRTGLHNTVARVGQTPRDTSIAGSVPIFNSYGVPNSKLIFGLAFYGVRQQRSFNESTSTWSSWSQFPPSVFYPEIVASYLNNPEFDYFFDTEAGVPYLLKKDGTVFISYDNPRSIQLKSEFIIENNLGGLMFWEYGTDTSGTLLDAMRIGLEK